MLCADEREISTYLAALGKESYLLCEIVIPTSWNHQIKIIESDGSEEDVRGPGVVGEYPLVFHGCPQFEYKVHYSNTDTLISA